VDQPVEIDLKQPELYINRELSLIEFNRRVLDLAKDPATPLIERLRFLCISTLNLDEFFEISVASVKEKLDAGSVQAGADNLGPADLSKAISAAAHDLVAEQYRVLNHVLIPELEAKSIRFIRRTDWTPAQTEWLHKFFHDEVTPLITPVALDPAHPFPKILNKSLNFIVSLKGKDAFGRNSALAIVQAPRALARIIRLPPRGHGNGPYDFVFLSSIIHAFIEEIFVGMKVIGCYQFRVTRNSDLFVDEEEVDDLLLAMEGELVSRRYGDAVRLEVADNCPQEVFEFLRKKFELAPEDIYQVNGPVNLNRLGEIYDLVEKPDLKYPAFTPSLPTALRQAENFFGTLRKHDVLLYHPFQSFVPIVDFIKQAAKDPKVIAIKQTLYRTGTSSAIVEALASAARAGKEVTIVIELRARFDEEANIALATLLQDSGAHVVYGVVGYKTHAKLCLVIRRERKRLHHYAHMATGNYHSRTARLYTDYGLLTSNKEITEDVNTVFQQLTSLGKVSKLHRLLQAPFTLHAALLDKIEREIKHAGRGRRAHVVIKVNSLVEPKFIQTLYHASQAGVTIDLIVRGICCLRPGIPGVSENIRVRSIIGRFLEHTRIYYFLNNENPELYLSSADCMERNFFRRIEVAFPIENEKMRARVLDDLNLYLSDNTQAWVLQQDGSYRHRTPAEGETAVNAQAALLEKYAEFS